MTQWAAFAGIVFLVVVLFLGLARASQSAVREPPPALPPADAPTAEHADGAAGEATDVPAGEATDRTAGAADVDPVAAAPAERPAPPWTDAGSERDAAGARPASVEDLSYRVLLANVVVSQAVFGVVLAFGVWYARVPLGSLGVAGPTPSALAVGAVLGVGLYLANEAGAAVADRVGIGHDERLRELLAPDSPAGWVALLGLGLPLVAGFEELLFRAALVGAIPAGFGASPWAMAAVSSVAFGLGHGAQGTTGVVVTGLLGFALAAAFVLTGSLLVVVVAHYLVNALEFVVHEGIG